MPLFSKKKDKSLKSSESPPKGAGEEKMASKSKSENGATEAPVNGASDNPPTRPKLMFHCQLAHGSPTGIISGFTNVRELYQKIADCYEMPVDQIVFCTLNTHKVDMTRLLGGQIGLDDFIFAHTKGQKKEIEITKDEESLGLTITDNGAGLAFIKRIRDTSTIQKAEHVRVGDHIEKIDGKNMVGCRHFDVARALKAIPVGSTFIIRLIETEKSGFSHIAAPTGGSGKKQSYGSGRETLRLRPGGDATVEKDDADVNHAVDKINGFLESFMGVSDHELARSLYDLGSTKDNPSAFAVAIDSSELGQFGFTDSFVFDVWGAISDAKSGRLKKVQEFSEDF